MHRAAFILLLKGMRPTDFLDEAGTNCRPFFLFGVKISDYRNSSTGLLCNDVLESCNYACNLQKKDYFDFYFVCDKGIPCK